MYFDNDLENNYDNFYADTRDYDARRGEIENIKISQGPSLFCSDFMSPAPVRKSAINALNI